MYPLTILSFRLHGFYTDAGYNTDVRKIILRELVAMKKLLWVFPVLAIGMAIGGLTLSNVFAKTSSQNSAETVQATQSMQQALSTPEGQAMIQACGGFMSQFYQNQK
ncbi:hypothetical protein JZ785_13400 [Alicyclobacillus curvatus]|nr:hypothetical protein JZ785_13400 [Alicyclobacillus curvatus]